MRGKPPHFQRSKGNVARLPGSIVKTMKETEPALRPVRQKSRSPFERGFLPIGSPNLVFGVSERELSRGLR